MVCRGGWLVCRLVAGTRAVDLLGVARSISDILERERTATDFAIDIPIGLPEAGSSRKCDVQARQLLTNAP
jgi:predicted RNase H-like nuclease